MSSRVIKRCIAIHGADISAPSIMQNFAIYPIDDVRFELEFETLQLNDETGEIELYNDNHELIAILVRQHIAAIVPTELRPTQRADMFTFSVYLKNHLDRPFLVNATDLERLAYAFVIDRRPLRAFYLDPQEVTAIAFRSAN